MRARFLHAEGCADACTGFFRGKLSPERGDTHGFLFPFRLLYGFPHGICFAENESESQKSEGDGPFQPGLKAVDVTGPQILSVPSGAGLRESLLRGSYGTV